MTNEEKILEMLEGLTAKVDGIESDMSTLKQEQQKTNKRLDGIESDISTLKQGQERANKRFDDIDKRFDILEEGQNQADLAVAELAADMRTTKDTVLKIEHHHGKLLAGLSAGYAANYELYERHEPKIAKLEKTVERHDVELLALKRAK